MTDEVLLEEILAIVKTVLSWELKSRKIHRSCVSSGVSSDKTEGLNYRGFCIISLKLYRHIHVVLAHVANS